MEIVLIVVGVLVAANVLMAGSIKHQNRPRNKAPRGTAPTTWRDLARYAVFALATAWMWGPGLYLMLWGGR